VKRLTKRMRRRIINILLFLVIFGISTPLMAWNESSVQAGGDTLVLQPVHRPFSQSQMESYKADKDFQYLEKPNNDLNLWQRLRAFLAYLLMKLYTVSQSTAWGKIITYIIFALVIGYLILKLLNIEVTRLFSAQGAAAPLSITLLDDNIHEMDFDALIAEAINKGHFREAIRFHYLHILKQLADAAYIHWEPGKTNEHYLAELKEGRHFSVFSDLNYFFVYTWYGEFEIKEDRYQRMAGRFVEFSAQIGRKEQKNG
jgi:hypothetical protein